MNYQEIGSRIQEQRKHIRKVSQEKMADDLMMYQADISNLEKGKKGSGITDLEKLSHIAEYLGISLDSLIFGTKEKMKPYFKKKTQIVKSKLTKEQKISLAEVMGRNEKDIKADVYSAEEYSVCVIRQSLRRGDSILDLFDNENKPIIDLPLDRYQLYTFYGNDVVASVTVVQTTLLENTTPCYIDWLTNLIPQKCLDVTDVLRHLIPFVPLAQFEDDKKKKDEYYALCGIRREKLLALGTDNPVLYIESAYVKNDCRQNGILTLNMDVLRKMFKDAIIWLNMEPSLDDELKGDGHITPRHSTMDITQITLNNLIAEKLGFTVDPDLWGIDVKDEETGNEDRIQVRKCAYIIPSIYEEILKDDDGLVEKGRLLQKLKQDKDRENVKDEKELKLEVREDGATMDISGFEFVTLQNNIDFENMRIANIRYYIHSSPANHGVGMCVDDGVATEMVLEDEKTKKKYFCTLTSFDCDHELFITDKPIKDTYFAIYDSEDDWEKMEEISDKSLAFYPHEPEGEVNLEGTMIKPVFDLLYSLEKLDTHHTDKIIERIKGKSLKDALRK